MTGVHTSDKAIPEAQVTALPRKPTFFTLQAGRGIASAMVVTFHSGVYMGIDSRFWLVTPYSKYTAFGRFGVEFFFVLSGIVILLAHWGDQGKPEALGSYIWKRFRRIFPVYWVVLAPVLIISLGTRSFGGGLLNWRGVLSSILLIHFNAQIGPVLVSWTLYHEVLFYLTFALIMINSRLGYACLMLWLLASVAMLVQPFGSPLVQDYLSHLHILFAFGMLIAVLIKKNIQPNPWALLVAGLAVFAWLYPWTVRHGVPPQNPGAGGAYSILGGVMFFFLILAVVTLEIQGRLAVPAWLILLGDASYAIYLVHFPLLSICARFFFRVSQHHASLLPLILFLQIFAAIGAGLLFHLGIEKPLLRLISTSGLRRAAQAA